LEDCNWHKQETYKSLIHYGSSTIKFVFLVNSGAIIALHAFIGDLLSENKLDLSNIKYSMYYFIGGIIASGLALVLACLAQLKLYNELNNENNHQCFLYISMICIFIGIVFFGMGAISSVDVLVEFNSSK
jgi:hypothetical protein